jgi:integrase
MPREPGYCHHKPSNQAYVRLGGKVFYLGVYGTEKSRQDYARLKAEWLTSKNAAKFVADARGITIAAVCLGYLDHAEVYYGKGTEFDNLKLAVKPLSELYATLRAAEFGPLEYKTVRDWWLQRSTNRQSGKLSRQYINAQMKRLMRIVKWAVAEGMIPASVHQTLKCVDPLKRGRVSAPEAEPVKPIDLATVRKTQSHMPPVVRDMVELQLLLGCRPGEVVKLKPSMIDRSGDVWTIQLDEHKTAYRGRDRHIYVGPKAQAILVKYLLRGADDFCFSPAEAMRQRREVQHANRKTRMSCGNKPGSNVKAKPKKQSGDSFTSMTYARAIAYACDKAFPADDATKANIAKLKAWKASHRWAPNRLRHTRATEIRSLFGLEAASSVLGHSEITVTQVYAEADRERAVAVAKAIG